MARVSKKKAKANAELSEEWAKTQLDKVTEEMENDTTGMGTRDLFLKTLTEIGCQYTEDEDSGRIHFRYEGGVFTASASNDYYNLTLYYLFFYVIEGYDKKAQRYAKNAVNVVNLNNPVQVVYYVDEDDKAMYISLKNGFLFIPQIPDLIEHLRSRFHEMYEAKHYFEAEMDKR